MSRRAAGAAATAALLLAAPAFASPELPCVTVSVGGVARKVCVLNA